VLDAVWPDPERRHRALAGLVEDGLLVRTFPDRYGLPGSP